jgi:hypothetical protein
MNLILVNKQTEIGGGGRRGTKNTEFSATVV